MDFETFMKGFDTPPPSSIDMDSEPVQVLLYIKSKGYLNVDLDFLDSYIDKHTPDNPDEWMVDEHCIGEIEDFRDIAVELIEASALEICENLLDNGGFKQELVNIVQESQFDED